MKQRRIVLFSHDGSGLGHLRRICRIAEELQDNFATLIVTGMRNALWMIPINCEFCYLPSWDSLRVNRAKYWGKDAWLDISLEEAIQFRSKILEDVISAFSPDAILVDYLPFGLHREMEQLIRKTYAKKYLILRGLIDTSDSEIFFGQNSKTIASVYDRIFIAADKKIIDIESEYPISSEFIKKTKYVGYVSPKNVDRKKIRIKRGVEGRGKKWIVCSTGGGKYSDEFVNECVKVAKFFPEIEFDIVRGPLSNSTKNSAYSSFDNYQIHSFLPNLADFHSSCDILVSSGGYNSLLEGCMGGAKVIVFPNQVGLDDEQINNSKKLSKYFSITLLNDFSLLSETINSLLDVDLSDMPNYSLITNGADNIREILLNEL